MNSIRCVALLLTAAAVTAQGQEWVFLDGPQSTAGGGVVQQHNGRHFLVGPNGSVFETENGRWLHRPTTGGPSGRTLPAYCYDSSRKIVYYYGGKRGLNYLGDLWKWDGTKWTDVTPASGPAPRWDALMAYDIVRDRVVMYGGSQNAGFSDTWEFDGTNWHATTPAAQTPDRGTAMAYDLVRQQCVLLGHQAIQGIPGTTWTWDGTDWTLADSNGPATGQGSGMAYDIARDVTVLAGGNPVSDEVWEWNGASWAQVGTLGAAARFRPSLSYDPHLGGVRLFGGQPITQSWGTVNGAPRADAWLWDGSTMQQVHESLRPPSRHRSAFVSDPFQQELLMFGGWIGLWTFDDTWTFDGDVWTQRTPQHSPSQRWHATLVADPDSGSVLLFGGAAAGLSFHDLWSWNGSDWTEFVTTGSKPSGRHSASLAHDPSSNSILLFGGYASPSYTNDLWRWNGSNWTQLANSGPPAREGAAMTYDPASGDILMFGGRDGFTLNDQKNDFWRYSNGAWQQVVTPTTLIPFFYPAMFFDPALGQVALVGTNPGGGTEKWTFDGTDWSLVHASQDGETSGRPTLHEFDGRTYVYSGSSLQMLTDSPAVAEDLGGACGQNAPHVNLRTRPRVGCPEFGFDIQASPNEFAFFCISEATGALPLFNCTVLLAGSITPMFAITDAFGRASQPIPLPANMALRGQDFFVHGSAWDVSQPLSQIRLANAWRFLIGD